MLPMKCLHVLECVEQIERLSCGQSIAAKLANQAILLAQVFFTQLNVPLHHSNVVGKCHV